jgi:hypothetical protein
MAITDFFEKLDLNIIIKKIGANIVGALLLLFIGLFFIELFVNKNDSENCIEKIQSLNDSIRKLEADEKTFYRSLYFEMRQNERLRDSLEKYQFIENFNAQIGSKQIILKAKKRVK